MIEDLFDLPVHESGLPVRPVTEATHAKLSKNQGKLASKVLKPREIGAEVGPAVEVDVESVNIDEGKLQVLRCWEVSVSHQALRVPIFSNVVEVPEESLNFLRTVPTDDVGRNLFPHAVHQHRRMAPAGGDGLFDLVADLPA